MNVLLNGCVCTNILSYTHLEYLFTATVCRTWKENTKGEVYTDLAAAFESPSRIQEAVENGVRCRCSEDTDDGEELSSCDFLMEYAEIVDADVTVFQKIHEMGYAWGAYTMQNAAIGNKVEIIKFMHQHGCPLTANVLFNAANYNCLELVGYLAENGCPIDAEPIETEDETLPTYNVRSLEKAISKNHLDVVMYLRSKMNFPFNDETFRVACNADYPKNLHTMAYLHAEGCVPPPFLLYEMIDQGNFHAVNFMLIHRLHENKCATAMCIAVARFETNIMRLLVAYDFEVSDDVVDLATYDIGLVKWLIRVGANTTQCRLTSGAYINTIEHEMDEVYCIEALDWLLNYWKIDIGFTSFSTLVKNERWSQALAMRHPSITDWFIDNLDS